jgi:hypothetical protein
MASALCAVFLRHIWGRGRCSATPYNLPQMSVTARTLCAICRKFFLILDKIINLCIIRILWQIKYYYLNNKNELKKKIIRFYFSDGGFFEGCNNIDVIRSNDKIEYVYEHTLGQ